MYYNIDLRFLAPPFLNIFFQFFLSSPQGGLEDLFENPIMWKIAFPILAFFLLFFTVSVKLPLSLSLSVRPVRVQVGDLYFSVLLALTLLGSILLPIALFCSIYFVCSCIFVASWPRSLVYAFRRWLFSLPAFVVAPDPAG